MFIVAEAVKKGIQAGGGSATIYQYVPYPTLGLNSS